MKDKLKNCLMLISILVILVSIYSNQLTVSAATNIALQTTTSYLVKGETTTLKVTGTSKKVTWSSTNKKVITVSSKGTVTPVGFGTAYVKAIVSGKTYKCFVRVIDPSKIYLDPSSSKVTVNGKTVSLNPSSDTYSAAAIKAMKITYKVYGNTGVKVSSTGKVTATKAGSFKVSAYVHGKKIETVSMKAVTPTPSFLGFSVSEVNVEAEKYKEVFFSNNYLINTDGDVKVSSSNQKVAKVELAFTTTDLDHYYGVEIEGVADGTATISVTTSGVTKTLKVIVGQGVNILAPVEAVKANNFTGYSGNSLATLQWIRQFIDNNNLDSDTLTDREKITIIQNYLNAIANKNTNNTYDGYISSIIFNGYYSGGDCEAYTATFCFLCECIDIEVLYCGGSSDNGNGIYYGHAWNKVKVDGTWYYIDSYWNACLNNFDYFLSKTLWSNHRQSEEGTYAESKCSDFEVPYVSEIK